MYCRRACRPGVMLIILIMEDEMISYRSFSCLGLSAFFLLSLATVSPASVQTGLPDFEANGGFSIHLKNGSGWQKIGSLSFDEFFREKVLNVAGDEGVLHLRLVKEGEGVAHIDRVLLDGQAPLSVTGLTDPVPLAKLMGKDFDVVHFPEGNSDVEFTFSGGGKLLLAARVEGERLDETPFRFPLANENRGITPAGNFYRYTPSTQPTRVFAEETIPGTGHPLGRTSAIALVKGDRLRLALDFEADNTLDGGKDYASLHVRSGDTIRTFTVSRDQQQWGTPHFTYTPGVPWQHKVYAFSVPLAELQADQAKPLELAFSAYGTAGPGNYSPILAYGSENNEYLSVSYYSYADNTSQVQTRLFSPAGAAMGGSLNVTAKDATYKVEPAAAYDPVKNRFLALWIQEDNGIGMVYRQLVSAANSVVLGTEKGVSLFGQRYPAASFSTVSNRYFVTWNEELNDGTYDIKGRLFNPDNTEYSGSVIDICVEAKSQDKSRIAYNPTSDNFIVVWDDSRNFVTKGVDIYGRLVGADGTLHGISRSLSSVSGNQVTPDVAYDRESNRSLVVWQDSRNGGTTGEDVYGQILQNGLLAAGDEIVISNGAGDQWGPQVAYAGNGHFLVVWGDRATSPKNELHGRWVGSNGEILSEEQVFVKLDDGQVYGPRLAGDGERNFLSVYGSITLSGGVQIGTKNIVAPSFSRLFLLGLPAQLNGGNN
jgi:hypothetical protein